MFGEEGGGVVELAFGERKRLFGLRYAFGRRERASREHEFGIFEVLPGEFEVAFRDELARFRGFHVGCRNLGAAFGKRPSGIPDRADGRFDGLQVVRASGVSDGRNFRFAVVDLREYLPLFDAVARFDGNLRYPPRGFERKVRDVVSPNGRDGSFRERDGAGFGHGEREAFLRRFGFFSARCHGYGGKREGEDGFCVHGRSR